MKTAIQPKLNLVIFHDVTSGAEFFTTSTLKSDETRKVDGKEYFIIKVETSSASHPFYTGTQKTASKGDQIKKYMEKVAKAQKGKSKSAKAETEKEEAKEQEDKQD